MDKYGYEQESKDDKTKIASKNGVCPICGAEITGQPPVCPTHGSEPFEKRKHDNS